MTVCTIKFRSIVHCISHKCSFAFIVHLPFVCKNTKIVIAFVLFITICKSIWHDLKGYFDSTAVESCVKSIYKLYN